MIFQYLELIVMCKRIQNVWSKSTSLFPKASHSYREGELHRLIYKGTYIIYTFMLINN